MAEKDFHSDQDILLVDGGDRFAVDSRILLVHETDGHNKAVALYHPSRLGVTFDGTEPPEDLEPDGSPDEILRKALKASLSNQEKTVRIGSHGFRIIDNSDLWISVKVLSQEPQLEVIPYSRKPGQHPAALLRRVIAGGLASR